MTVKVAVPSPSAAVALATVIAGTSSSVMTKSAVVVSPAMVALLAEARVNVAVSITSSTLSNMMGTLIMPELSPAEIVRVFVTAA